MATVAETEATAKSLVGARIEIPVHYDLWMRKALGFNQHEWVDLVRALLDTVEDLRKCFLAKE